MTALLILTAIVSVSLIAAGVRASRSAQPAAPQFAHIVNGRDTDDGLKAHR